MTWGQFRAAWFQRMGKKAVDIPDMVFGVFADQAQSFLASVLPANAVPELTTSVELTLSSGSVALPDDFLKVIGCEDKNGSTYTSAIRHTAADFRVLEGLTNDAIYAIIDNKLYAQRSGSASSDVRLTYRARPSAYSRAFGYPRSGMIAQMMQSVTTNAHRVSIYTTATADLAWGDAGCPLELEDVQGGHVIFLNDDLAVNTDEQMYRCKIRTAWDEPNHYSGSYDRPMFQLADQEDWFWFNGTGGSAQPFYGVIVTSYTAVDATWPIEQDDADSPELDAEWHGLMLDYMHAQYELSQGDAKRGTAMMNVIYGTLQNTGAVLGKIDDSQ